MGVLNLAPVPHLQPQDNSMAKTALEALLKYKLEKKQGETAHQGLEDYANQSKEPEKPYVDSVGPATSMQTTSTATPPSNLGELIAKPMPAQVDLTPKPASAPLGSGTVPGVPVQTPPQEDTAPYTPKRGPIDQLLGLNKPVNQPEQKLNFPEGQDAITNRAFAIGATGVGNTKLENVLSQMVQRGEIDLSTAQEMLQKGKEKNQLKLDDQGNYVRINPAGPEGSTGIKGPTPLNSASIFMKSMDSQGITDPQEINDRWLAQQSKLRLSMRGFTSTATPGIVSNSATGALYDVGENGDLIPISGAQARETNLTHNEQKATTATKTRQQIAPSLLNKVEEIKAVIAAHPEMFGPGAGRWNELITNKGGVNNPEFNGVRQNLALLDTLLTIMHTGARPTDQLRQELSNPTKVYQSPENMLAALNNIDVYAHEISQSIIKPQQSVGRRKQVVTPQSKTQQPSGAPSDPNALPF